MLRVGDKREIGAAGWWSWCCLLVEKKRELVLLVVVVYFKVNCLTPVCQFASLRLLFVVVVGARGSTIDRNFRG